MNQNASLTAAAAANIAAVPDQSPIHTALHQLESTQSYTHDLISALTSRLDAVLTPPSQSKPGIDEALAGASPLHSSLSQRVANARGHNTRLQDLLDRLTVG